VKESKLIKMQKEIKELQDFVVMLHFELKSLRDGKDDKKRKETV
tara:strand:- start:124 stop:255 length:132 start_codon:yes stop_codon:yes gene_type:complete